MSWQSPHSAILEVPFIAEFFESSLYVLNPTRFAKKCLMESSVSLFSFTDHADGVYLATLHLTQDYKDFLLSFLLKALEFYILPL